MLQQEIYFFGKLKQSRDFIVSDNLQTSDKFFLENWFSRCTGQDRLIPFVKKTFHPSKIWLFCIKFSEELTYTGITALSSDKIGRIYPFVLFYKSNSDEDLKKQLELVAGKINFFSDILNSGKYIDNYNSDSTCAHIINLNSEVQISLQHCLSGNSFSFWIDSKSGYYIEHEGTLSCSLFNRLFG